MFSLKHGKVEEGHTRFNNNFGASLVITACVNMIGEKLSLQISTRWPACEGDNANCEHNSKTS